MRPLSSTALLDVWEQGQGLSPTQRALLLLQAAHPEYPAEVLSQMPIGRRDALLLALRAWTLGLRLDSVATCPACRAPLEFTCSVEDLWQEAETPPPETFTVEHAGQPFRFRPPDSRDVLAVARLTPEAARQHLLHRCLVEAPPDTEPDAPLPEALAAQVAQAMAEADPMAEVQLALTCPACEHTWTPVFDIVAYFWQELSHLAVRLLTEVHHLASAYGWREADILALSAQRRRWYLDLSGR
jgi:hypothetical protein